LRIQIKSGARLSVSKQPLNRLYISALIYKKGGEAMAEVVEPESLPRFEPDANLNRGWANFILCHRRENSVVRLRIERVNNGQETPYRSPYR
jgi:hypothetical protein